MTGLPQRQGSQDFGTIQSQLAVGQESIQFKIRDEGTWFSRLRFKWLVTCMIECALHMHVSDSDCPEFRNEIPFKEGRM